MISFQGGIDDFMKTYKDQYEAQIEPQLQQIDIFLKTKRPPYSIDSTAKLLHISAQEVKKIMKEESLSKIDRQSFFMIMKKGSSTICHLFSRELFCGTPKYYTVEAISYIYNIDVAVVLEASQKMGMSQFSPESMKTLFCFIPPQTIQ